MNTLTATVSKKGQIVIPAAIRKAQGITSGTKLSFQETKDGIIVKKIPTELDWNDLLKNIPHETVEFDESGHYDPKQAPNFDEWMHEDDE